MNKQKKLIFFCTVFFIALVSAYAQNTKIKIEEVLTIGQDDEGIIFQWVGLTTDKQRNVYITDLKDYSIKKFDEEGKFIKKTGRKGQGPGEFTTPGIIRFKDGNLFVGQFQNTGIQVFDTDLNYIKNISLRVIPTSFQLVDEEQLAISQLSSNKIQVFNFNGENLNSFQYNQDHDWVLNAVDFDKSKDSYYLCFKWQDIICKYSISGQKIWERNILNVDKIETKKIGGIALPKDVCFKTICFDNKNYLYILGGHLSKNINRDVYILSQNGEWIDTITLPEQTHMIHVDSNNFLYSRSEYGTLVKKFKLIYND